MTVSVALHGTGNGRIRVAEATRARIQEAAATLAYRPNRLARSLLTKRTGVLGLYTGQTLFNADSTFTAQLLAGLQRGCAEQACDLILHRGTRIADPSHFSVTYAAIDDGLVDGLVVRCEADDPLVASIQTGGLPAVAVADALPGIPSVTSDDAAGGRLLAAHLLQRGHRRVVWLSGRHGDTASQCERREAFCAVIRQAGATVTLAQESSSRGLGDAARTRLDLGQPQRATAIACYADHAAWGVIAETRALGWRLPTDVAVCGYDGIQLFGEPLPAQELTTMVADWGYIGMLAVAAVAARIAGETLPPLTCHPPTLRQGQTT